MPGSSFGPTWTAKASFAHSVGPQRSIDARHVARHDARQVRLASNAERTSACVFEMSTVGSWGSTPCAVHLHRDCSGPGHRNCIRRNTAQRSGTSRRNEAGTVQRKPTWAAACRVQHCKWTRWAARVMRCMVERLAHRRSGTAAQRASVRNLESHRSEWDQGQLRLRSAFATCTMPADLSKISTSTANSEAHVPPASAFGCS